MTITFQHRHPLFFAEVIGVDLRNPLSEKDWRTIYNGFNEHAILLFRDQHLNDEQHIAFSERFGPVIIATNYHWRTEARRVHPQMADISNIDNDGDILAADDERRMHTLANRLWHTDNTFKFVPSRCSLLLAREVPEESGDTEFADMRAAYDALPQSRKDGIEALIAEHSIVHSRKKMGFDSFTDGAKNELPPVPQVLVRQNYDTGRKALYIGSHASHIVGWPKVKGRTLLKDLIAHATQPKFIYRHRWRPGDLIVWDNRCTMHRATEYDDLNVRRDLQRTTVSDEINSVERRQVERESVA
ncbi:MAG: Alpha-ketoglutarate-dependent 2,4-dichlorophenoxyacetate dioxygenase [Alphaproteobacteria bacterium MarineAlpha4_Bin2]|nr:MAG: Alpha-ketoglutarate-dependent 2,4-dichlorophenoxyacetate dioxygenase [Alphaproteobacteria bacterium MarineAlpha4_Bin2]